jgi:hypothetical protein
VYSGNSSNLAKRILHAMGCAIACFDTSSSTVEDKIKIQKYSFQHSK